MSSTNPPAALDDAPALAARRLDDLAARVTRSESAATGADSTAEDGSLDVFAPATGERIGSVPA